MTGQAAAQVGRIVEAFLGSDPPVLISCWDDSLWGDLEAPLSIRVTHPNALRRLVWAPNELGLGRAYVAGELDVEGSIFDLFALRDHMAADDQHVAIELGPRQWLSVLGAAHRLGALGRPLPPPPQEARLKGRLHSRARDRQAISHHYDVGNDFYRLVLGPTMTYSCAYWPEAATTLDEAQEAKYELICRKLDLRPGMRLLDVGCGWGGMVLHAARHHGVEAVGVTISEQQATLAADRVRDAGLDDRVRIQLCDYRDVAAEPFDAISSIGMFEHVGMERLRDYIESLRGLLAPGGRLLNHAISRPEGVGGFDRKSFNARYVFPDGELQEVGRVISAMQDAGLECRDVESLREHYGRTLRAWVDNLETNWDEAVELVGGPRARIWRLYMAGSAIGFEANRINVHQVLLTRTTADGDSRMPPTRADFAAVPSSWRADAGGYAHTP